ncbi:MAG TPA: hypothetical protein PLD77_00230 [Candidatus Dojkabacteria bacterium]|nr:hypothetical protein [Candidatus Dojkabacteria bacterium]
MFDLLPSFLNLLVNISHSIIIIKEIAEYKTQFFNSAEVTRVNALFKNNDGSMEKRM